MLWISANIGDHKSSESELLLKESTECVRVLAGVDAVDLVENEHITEPGFACLMIESNASVYTSRSARWLTMWFCPVAPVGLLVISGVVLQVSDHVLSLNHLGIATADGRIDRRVFAFSPVGCAPTHG